MHQASSVPPRQRHDRASGDQPPEESLALRQVRWARAPLRLAITPLARRRRDGSRLPRPLAELKEGLDTMDARQVTLQLTSPTIPGILRPVGPDPDNYFNV